ncbi:MAG: hypothetical protein ACRDUV_00795 [Pseudonocardiaceae bacterium]
MSAPRKYDQEFRDRAVRMYRDRLAATVHAYPTWSSAVQLAAAQFFMSIDGRIARNVSALTDEHREDF